MASPFLSRPLDATYADDLGTEFVTIYVGPDRKKFGVHKNLLTSQSEYFDKALNGGFKEAEENSIHLEEDDPAAIALLVGWLYRGEIPGPAPQSIHVEGAFPTLIVDKMVQPVGGTSAKVDAYTEQEPNTGVFGQTITYNCFQSISCHPQYNGYSSEELRLADYAEGRKYKLESENLAHIVPDVRSSGGGLGDVAQSVDNSMTGVGGAFGSFGSDSLWGSTPLTGGGIGGVASSAANSISGGGGLFGIARTAGSSQFGSNPRFGGGIAGVAQSAVSSSLFGNPPPAGSSLSSPSTVVSSGGVFVNLGAQAQRSDDTTSNPSSALAGAQYAGFPTNPATIPAHISTSTLASYITRTALSRDSGPDTSTSMASSSTSNATPQPPQDSDGSSGGSSDIINNDTAATQRTSLPQTASTSQALPIDPTQQASSAGSRFPLNLTLPQPLSLPSNFPFHSSTTPSEFSRFNPAKFGNHNTTHNPFHTNFPTFTTSPHQLALLNLTLFAEASCWPTLYNASMTFYVSGERTLNRPPPLDHITLIYDRTHDESSLRRWAVDSLAAHKGDVDMSGYMSLLVDYEGFLEGVLRKLRDKAQKGEEEQAPGCDGAGGLKYRMLEHGKKNPFGGGKGKERAF